MKLLQTSAKTKRFNLPIASVSALTWLTKDSKTRILPRWCSLGLRIAIDYITHTHTFPISCQLEVQLQNSFVLEPTGWCQVQTLLAFQVPSLWLRLSSKSNMKQRWWPCKVTQCIQCRRNATAVVTTVLRHAKTQQCWGGVPWWLAPTPNGRFAPLQVESWYHVMSCDITHVINMSSKVLEVAKCLRI